MESKPEWPLETRIVTVFKVKDCTVFHHTNENPYYQITVGGHVLDGWGEIVGASIELSADDGDIDAVRKLESIYCQDSIHQLDTALFGTIGGWFHFYGPVTTPLPQEKYDAINRFFTAPKWGSSPEIPDLEKITLSSISSLREQEDGSYVRILCRVSGIREIHTRSGNLMAFVTVRDLTGEAEVTVFSDIYDQASSMIKSDAPLLIAGKLELGEKGPCIILSGPAAMVSQSGKSEQR